jgi:hypothetical protein
MWKTGQLTGLNMTPGIPVVPPLPPNLKSVTIPKDVRDRMKHLTGGETPEVVRAEDLQPWVPESTGGAVVMLGFACVGAGVIFGVLARRLG